LRAPSTRDLDRSSDSTLPGNASASVKSVALSHNHVTNVVR
jgi:hypothetical protein